MFDFLAPFQRLDRVRFFRDGSQHLPHLYAFWPLQERGQKILAGHAALLKRLPRQLTRPDDVRERTDLVAFQCLRSTVSRSVYRPDRRRGFSVVSFGKRLKSRSAEK